MARHEVDFANKKPRTMPGLKSVGERNAGQYFATTGPPNL
jgi:hypothetical protein